ncbi:uncharacterized protein YqcC (DUF446 family) [Halospina denitrificans]|uniref:Uncharacterized protein YqcC (DUF446 family) n=1 Tax=Halospina denitrificans TaxID=332522 RepID=A0A4R7JZK3_9GAMM|nr:YqcC family protein [Halospina denitrificans]TDT43067.1 uncharacterized protein YqcC (DUF446 family) [Halospina denitrificans]
MTDPQHARQMLDEALAEVEAQLRHHGLLESEPPAPEALASRQPFCIDTLRFPQWVQFVFLPQLSERLNADDPMPDYCEVAPMAEEYFRTEQMAADAFIEALRELDRLVTASH